MRGPGAHVDFLRVSLDEGLGPSGATRLGQLFSDHCSGYQGVAVVAGHMRHYPTAYQAEREGVRLGGYGMGAGHRRALYELTGRGCEGVRHWGNVFSFLQGVRPKLTRLDTCVDFFAGEVTVDAGLELYKAGAFDRRGVHPKHSMLGPWGEVDQREGRTLYVKGAAWQICIYEKGLHEGGSPLWVRVEVRTYAESGVDLSALLNPDAHWRAHVGSWASLVEQGVPMVRVKAARRSTTLARRVRYAAESAGGLIACLRANGWTAEQVCRLLAGERPGERLDPFELRALAAEYVAR